LKNSISGLFNIEKVDVISNIKKKKDKPYIICFFGVNGSGKTTTIAKFARLLYNNKLSAVFAASDTFRAAAIQQLEEHAVNLGVKIIKHDYGSDSAAVAFDAVKYAQAHNVDVVLIDTAGRMHSNTNLMDELKKIIKVVKPDIKIFVGESITGNDCIEQAQVYDKEIGIDGIILTKADVDDKGGAAISISYVTKKPILYMGMGQKYDDLKPFDKNELVNALGL
jgi:fused signal recognition particle receptor